MVSSLLRSRNANACLAVAASQVKPPPPSGFDLDCDRSLVVLGAEADDDNDRNVQLPTPPSEPTHLDATDDDDDRGGMGMDDRRSREHPVRAHGQPRSGYGRTTGPTAEDQDGRSDLRQALVRLHHLILALPSLDPGPETNALFSALVALVTRPDADADGQGDAEMAAQTIEMAHGRFPTTTTTTTDRDRTAFEAAVRELPSLCAEAESRLERWWALRVIPDASPPPPSSTSVPLAETPVASFPYFSNYVQLTRLEYHLLRGLGADPRHVLFLGSGPLPLTSLILATDHIAPRWGGCAEVGDGLPAGAGAGAAAFVPFDGHDDVEDAGDAGDDDSESSPLPFPGPSSRPAWSITNVDMDLKALSLSRALTERVAPELVLPRRGPSPSQSQKSPPFSFHASAAAALDPSMIARADTIFLAALVGLRAEEKDECVRHVARHMSPGAMLLIRSADGPKSLIYPRVRETAIASAGEGRLVVEATLHPRNEVINSCIVARRI